MVSELGNYAVRLTLLCVLFAILFFVTAWALYSVPYYALGLKEFNLSRSEAAAGAGLSIVCAVAVSLWRK